MKKRGKYGQVSSDNKTTENAKMAKCDDWALNMERKVLQDKNLR